MHHRLEGTALVLALYQGTTLVGPKTAPTLTALAAEGIVNP